MSSRVFNPFKYDPEHSIVHYPRAEKIAERIEKAINMNITNQYSSEQYQITSYGLGGLCEDHNDPYGYNEGVELHGSNQILKDTGDIFGTVKKTNKHSMFQSSEPVLAGHNGAL